MRGLPDLHFGSRTSIANGECTATTGKAPKYFPLSFLPQLSDLAPEGGYAQLAHNDSVRAERQRLDNVRGERFVSNRFVSNLNSFLYPLSPIRFCVETY